MVALEVVARSAGGASKDAARFKRLSREERRAQLLEVAETLLASRRFADISVEDIAAAGGVSPGLLYRYFPNKEAFFAAAVERAADELVSMCEPAPGTDSLAAIRAGVSGYLDFLESRPTVYLNLFRDDAVALPTIVAVVDATRGRLVEVILRSVPLVKVELPATRLALWGYTANADATASRWLEQGEPTRERVEDLLLYALTAALAAGLAIDLCKRPDLLAQLLKETAPIHQHLRARLGIAPA